MMNTYYYDFMIITISPSVKTSQLTNALVVLLVLSTESLMSLLLHCAFGCTLDLGRGTGLTLTSDWPLSVTAG